MPREDFVSVSIKAGIMERIDSFVASNDSGFTNRAEVLTTAVREFLDREQGRMRERRQEGKDTTALRDRL